MQSSKGRRKVGSTTAGAGIDSAEKLDELLISSAICNGEDLGPFVRKTFGTGKPETLLHHLKFFARSKESEIEEVCKAHYQDFIHAVDDLKSLLSDVESLKSALSDSNSKLQSVAAPLLSSLDSLVEAQTVSKNVDLAIGAVTHCVRVMELVSRANQHLQSGNFYMALKCVDSIESDFMEKTPSSTLKRMLENRIPAIRSYVERKVNKEFGDWLVEIRVVSRNLGQLAIGEASAARQREEELRIKQRQAEEQSRLSLRDCVYALNEEEDDEFGSGHEGSDGGSSGGGLLGFDLTPLYRAYHIHQTLSLGDTFKQYYYNNRDLQLTSDFQIAGFFIVEDRVLRTGGGLISKLEVETLWDTAVTKMCAVLEDQFSRMQTANHLLLIKDYVSLLGVSLRRDKYHELLLSDCRKQITEALSADKFEQMLMKKEYEYSMNVLSFQLQTSEIVPAFPFIAPFSTTVPDCCRIVRSFIEDSVSFMSHGGQLDFYDVVKKYLDRLLGEVLDEALLKLISTSVHGVSQAMQVAANMAVFERACDFFFRHAAHLSGVPLRMAERGRRHFPLTKSQNTAEDTLSGMLKKKIDGFMTLLENVNWTSDDIPQGGNEYMNEVLIYLETLVSTAQQILPAKVLKRVLRDVLAHISEKIVGTLCGDLVKRLSMAAIKGLDVDIQLLDSFTENLTPLLTDKEAREMKKAFVEIRQMINLLLSSHPENFVNPVIRERSYNALDYRKVATVSEKFRDPSDSIFGTFGTRGSRQNPKNKSLDALIKRLKDVS
ncbi:AT4g02350 [Arabidopsis thaliana]|nr:T14P8.16 [Arabidopsis thaliana]CAB80728.1 AT4g02350 [Arabidopsis thaliana]